MPRSARHAGGQFVGWGTCTPCTHAQCCARPLTTACLRQPVVGGFHKTPACNSVGVKLLHCHFCNACACLRHVCILPRAAPQALSARIVHCRIRPRVGKAGPSFGVAPPQEFCSERTCEVMSAGGKVGPRTVLLHWCARIVLRRMMSAGGARDCPLCYMQTPRACWDGRHSLEGGVLAAAFQECRWNGPPATNVALNRAPPIGGTLCRSHVSAHVCVHLPHSASTITRPLSAWIYRRTAAVRVPLGGRRQGQEARAPVRARLHKQAVRLDRGAGADAVAAPLARISLVHCRLPTAEQEEQGVARK